jgi:hypothetical protein
MARRPDGARRGRLFGLVVLVAIALGVGYVLVAGGALAAEERLPADDPAVLTAARRANHVFVRHAGFGQRAGRIAIVAAADPSAHAALTDLACERFHFAGDRGLCLTSGSGFFLSYRALLVDAELSTVATLELGGIPSRARVSPDGRYAATTVFVSGHSYAGGSFSTQTQIIDARSGALVVELEHLSVTRDGRPFEGIDFNFWGVTFAGDGDTFFATLGTDGDTYLVRGSIAGREMTVVAANVECPSLSPDGTRVAFKERVNGAGSLSAGGPIVWRPAVLNLSDLSRMPVGLETRSIDDQIEWLDDERVLYEHTDLDDLSPSLWVTAVNGGAPQPYLAEANSPAAIAVAAD